MRSPILLYELGLGRVFGHRFLVVVHRGRRSGARYRTMLEVVRWRPGEGEAVVASGWGTSANWWRNIEAAPALAVWWAAERFVPEQRVLELDERIEVLREYRHEHPHAARILGPLLGLESSAAIDIVAERLPMIAFSRRAGRGR